jgi:superfamily II DNA or RNA helicase
VSTKFFNNQDGNTLLKKFEGIFENYKVSKFDALVGFLRASGYFAIKKYLKPIPKVRILVGINVDNVIQKYHKLGLEFNSDSEKVVDELKNFLKKDIQDAEYQEEVENGILEFIHDIASGKIEIAAHPSKNIHAKIYIFKPDNFNEHNSGSVISGSSNLSASGIGSLPISNYEFNVELKDYDDVKYASDEFEKLWSEAVNVLPAEELKSHIKSLIDDTYLNETITPHELYIKFLIEYFGESVNFDPTSVSDIPNNYKKLDYQADAVNEGFELLKKHNGFFLSDVVGTGKTIISTLIAKKVFNFNLHKFGHITKTLVIAPSTIEQDWKKVIADFNLQNIKFLPNRSFHKLNEPEYDPNSFDLIIVDEAHKFRSNTASSYNELQRLCKTPSSIKDEEDNIYQKKIILISASPLNNSPEDIKNQILLFQDGKNSTLEISNIDFFFNQKIKDYNELKKTSDKKIIREKLKNIYGEIREKIISQIMIRRTRTDLMKINQYKKNLDEQNITFPKTGKPNKIFYELEPNLEILYDKTIDVIKKLNYSIYEEIKNLKPDFKNKYEMPEVAYSALSDIMQTLLIKRLDSSFEAFKKTLGNLKNQLQSKVLQFQNKKIFILNSKDKIDVTKYILDDQEDELEAIIHANPEAGDIYKPEDFEDGYYQKISDDFKVVDELFDSWNKVNEDPKYDIFLKNLKEKFLSKEINKNQKLIIFSEAKVTTDYLVKRLKSDGYEKVFAVDGTNRSLVKPILQSEFDENFEGERSDKYNILISTEVLSEGINLHRSNVIVNYDTPWNSTKLIQRIGRVNRIGSKADRIHVFNFFPTSNVEGDIGLEKRAYLKLQSFHEALGEDSQIYHEAEETQTFGIFDQNIDEERNEKLKYLIELREFKENNELLFRQLKTKEKRQRTGRITNQNDLNTSSITFVKNERKNSFYLIDKDKKVFEKTFLEIAELFKATKEEKRYKLHGLHHDQIQVALKKFDEDQNTKVLELEKADFKLGPQTKQALAFLDACSRANFLSGDEKKLINDAKKSVKISKFIELQREINRLKKSSKNTNLNITKIIDALLIILKKYPITENQIYNTIEITPPEIIISESFSVK